MLDTLLATNTDIELADPLECDLCIIGAGVAGLNALFVATEYLSKDATVVLIDRHEQCGGMWNDTYEYVRLHQPHGTFTAGDIPWDWEKPKDYLATGQEVQAHMAHCLEKLREKITLVELYGYEFDSYEEILTPGGARTRIGARDKGGLPCIIKAQRTINATGFDVSVSNPLPLSSPNVVSTTPGLLDQNTGHDAPVYVVGGGKTGMDTVQALLKQTPGRKITLINGKGTVFGNRNKLFPTGLRRWWKGKLQLSSFSDVSMRFDGTNEDEVFAYFRDTYAISPDGKGEQYFFGLLSEEECQAIGAGLHEIVHDYLADVVDTDDGPEMLFRSGERRPAEPGSVFVNCTGHLLRAERPYEPYLSKHGTILAITPRSAIYFLTTASAYFLTHLFFLGKLREAPLYELDMSRLIEKGRKVWYVAGLMHSFMNTIVIMNTVPFKVLDRCGLDLDRWFPLPRRFAALVDVKLNQRKYLAHCRKSLDRVQARYDIRCGRLSRD